MSSGASLPKSAGPKRPQSVSLKGLVIFAVDDEPIQIEVLRNVLEKESCRVIGTDNPQVMLELFRFNRPDLVIADIMMPKIDGWELFRQMRETELNKETPVIFLTSLATPEEENQFTPGEGRCRVLAKPIVATKLVAAIKQFLSALGV